MLGVGNPCRLGGSKRFTAGNKIRRGPLMSIVATQPLESGGSLAVHGEGQQQQHPTTRVAGYSDPAAWVVLNTS